MELGAYDSVSDGLTAVSHSQTFVVLLPPSVQLCSHLTMFLLFRVNNTSVCGDQN